VADYDQAIRLDPKWTTAYIARAGAYLEKSDFDRAAADLSKAIEMAPDEASFWYWRGLARMGAGRLDEYRKGCAAMLQHFGQTEDAQAAHWAAWTCALAPDAVADSSRPVALARNAAKSDPTSIQYLVTHGAVLYRAGRLQQAIQRLTEADRLVPDPTKRPQMSPAYTWFFLGMAHHRLGHGDEAKNYLEKAVRSMDEETREPQAGSEPRLPWNRRVTLRLFCEEAQSLLKTDASQLRESPAQRAEACYDRGRAHADKAELAKAIAAYDEAIKLDPHWAEYHRDRGDAHAQKGNLDVAIADFNEVIRLDPGDAEARVNRGSLYVDKSEPRKAEADFKEALRINPDCGQDCLRRAESYGKSGRRERQLAEYRKAMRLDPPQYAGVYFVSASMFHVSPSLSQPDKAKLQQVLEECRKLVRLSGGADPAWLQRLCCWLTTAMRGAERLPGILFVSDMPWVKCTCGWGPPYPGRNGYGGTAPIVLPGVPCPKAVVTHAFADQRPADVVVDIAGQKFATFKAYVARLGGGGGTVQFQVVVDGKVKHETPLMCYGTVREICVDLADAKEVVLRVLNGGDGNSSDSVAWGYPRLVQAGAEDPLEVPLAELQSATDANAALFLAEVHWRLDHKDLARRWYDKVVEWMEKNKPKDEKLRAYRAEAEALLKQPSPSQKPKPAPQEKDKARPSGKPKAES